MTRCPMVKMLALLCSYVKAKEATIGMKIAVGCDHGGFELKQAVIKFLTDNGYGYQDFGTYDTQSCALSNICL